MAKPAVLIHPPLATFEASLIDYEVVHWPTQRRDVRAAIVLGSHGLSNAMIDALPRLGLIVCFGAGHEGIDLVHCKARDIAVTHARHTNHDDVAELALGLVIAVARSFTLGERLLRQGAWAPRTNVARPQRRLRGKKLGIVGMGAIGAAIAQRAQAFGMDIQWTGPRPKPEVRYAYQPDLIALATWADILAVAARGDQIGLISAAVIDALGADGILVNVSRGGVVDEDALIAALKAGKLGGAGLDVFVREPTPPARWADVPNTTLMPHIGGATPEALAESWDNVRENLRRFFAGEPLLTPIQPESKIASD